MTKYKTAERMGGQGRGRGRGGGRQEAEGQSRRRKRGGGRGGRVEKAGKIKGGVGDERKKTGSSKLSDCREEDWVEGT